jgi:hypothetical protein
VLVEQGQKRFTMARYAQVAKLMQNQVVKAGFGLLGELGVEADVARDGVAAAPLAQHELHKKPMSWISSNSRWPQT